MAPGRTAGPLCLRVAAPPPRESATAAAAPPARQSAAPAVAPRCASPDLQDTASDPLSALYRTLMYNLREGVAYIYNKPAPNPTYAHQSKIDFICGPLKRKTSDKTVSSDIGKIENWMCRVSLGIVWSA